jgi:hypothetical protein
VSKAPNRLAVENRFTHPSGAKPFEPAGLERFFEGGNTGPRAQRGPCLTTAMLKRRSVQPPAEANAKPVT